MRRWIFFLLMFLVFGIGVLELLYRFQLVDCYRGELRRNTKVRDLREAEGRKTLLIMGDSFSAQTDTFAFGLRPALDGDWRMINSAVGGTGIVQARIMAPGRFRRFRPSLFLYQVYVGNDLFDLRYPTDWGKASVQRNLYWMASRNLRSLAWLNYKSGQIWAGMKHRRPSSARPAPLYRPEKDVFSPERFAPRDRIHARAQPSLVADSVLLRGQSGRIFGDYLREMDRLLKECRPSECRVILLVVPHFSQLGPDLAENARLIGLDVPTCPEFFSQDYPFVVGLEEYLRHSRPDGVLINPMEEFRRKDVQGHRLYFQNDSHLNPIGQRLLAEIVRRQLRDLADENPQLTTDPRAASKGKCNATKRGKTGLRSQVSNRRVRCVS